MLLSMHTAAAAHLAEAMLVVAGLMIDGAYAR